MVSAAVHPDNFTACEFDGKDRYQCTKSKPSTTRADDAGAASPRDRVTAGQRPGALAYQRCRTVRNTSPQRSEFELGFSGNQRVHSDPVNKTTTGVEMSTNTTPSTSPSVAAQIARLPDLPMADPGALAKVGRGDTPTHNRQFSNAGLPTGCRRQSSARSTPTCWSATSVASNPWSETGKVKNATAITVRPPAPVLVREYKGVEHRVIATADGQYDFQAACTRASR